MTELMTLAEILNVSDSKYEDIDMMPFGWTGSVRIQSLTGEGKDAYELWIYEENEEGDFKLARENMRAKLIAACAINGDGSRLFKTEEHIKILGRKNSRALDYLYEACNKLNAMTDADVEELKGN